MLSLVGKLVGVVDLMSPLLEQSKFACLVPWMWNVDGCVRNEILTMGLECIQQIKDNRDEIMKKKRKFGRKKMNGCKIWELYRWKNVEEIRGEKEGLKDIWS